jgi:hypothetical protein
MEGDRKKGFESDEKASMISESGGCSNSNILL